MINKLSVLLLKYFVDKSDSLDDIEIYHFALFVILSNVLYSLVAILVGIVFSCIIEMIVFLLAFNTLRHFAGGYHSDSEYICEVVSIVTICLVAIIISLSKKLISIHNIFIFTAIISFVSVVVFSPVEAVAKPLTKKERKKYKKISVMIAFGVIIITVTTFFYKFNIIYIPCCLSLILESILLTVGKVPEVFSHER